MTLKGHDNWVRGLAFHPAGKYLLSVSDDRSIRCWDLSQRGRCVKVVQDAHHHFISCIRWAPSIASSNDATQPFGEARSPAASMGPASAAGSALAGRGLKANRLLSLSAANNPAAKKEAAAFTRELQKHALRHCHRLGRSRCSKSGCNKKEKSGLFYFFFLPNLSFFFNLCFLVVFFVFSLMKGYDFLSFFSLLILILYMSVWLFFLFVQKKNIFLKSPQKITTVKTNLFGMLFMPSLLLIFILITV